MFLSSVQAAATQAITFFYPDCIFCRSETRRRVKVQGNWTTQGLSQFEYDGGKAVLEMAESKED